jgi:hypothetical protein
MPSRLQPLCASLCVLVRPFAVLLGSLAVSRCVDPSGAAIPVQGTEGGTYRRRTAQYCVAHDRLSQAVLDDASQAQGAIRNPSDWDHKLD